MGSLMGGFYSIVGRVSMADSQFLPSKGAGRRVVTSNSSRQRRLTSIFSGSERGT